MTDEVRKRRQAILAEYAEEEVAAAEVEVAERNAALDVPLNLRIDRALDHELRVRASAAQIPTSALVRQLLRQCVHGESNRREPLTEERVEEIARRVVRDSQAG